LSIRPFCQLLLSFPIKLINAIYLENYFFIFFKQSFFLLSLNSNKILLQTMVSRRVKNFKCKLKEQIWEKKNKRLYKCLKGRKSGKLVGIADERWRMNNSWRLIWQDIRTRWQLFVMREREEKKIRNLLEKKITIDNCLLREKYNI